MSQCNAAFDCAGVALKLSFVFFKESLRSIEVLKADAALIPPQSPVQRTAVEEFQAYFAGRLRRFSLPLAPLGSAFSQRVWQELCRIPYGETRSYGEVAAALAQPKAARAVGAACGRNPLLIVIPCHRVLAADGSLHAYSEGLALKKALLSLEGARV